MFPIAGSPNLDLLEGPVRFSETLYTVDGGVHHVHPGKVVDFLKKSVEV